MELKAKGPGFESRTDDFFLFFICLSCDKNTLEIKHILSADYICFLLYWELDRIFGIRADLSSRQYFFLGDMKYEYTEGLYRHNVARIS